MPPISIGEAMIEIKQGLLEICDDLIEDIKAVEKVLLVVSNLNGGRSEVLDAWLDAVLGDLRTHFEELAEHAGAKIAWPEDEKPHLDNEPIATLRARGVIGSPYLVK
jgi:hypothetical protein